MLRSSVKFGAGVQARAKVALSPGSPLPICVGNTQLLAADANRRDVASKTGGDHCVKIGAQQRVFCGCPAARSEVVRSAFSVRLPYSSMMTVWRSAMAVTAAQRAAPFLFNQLDYNHHRFSLIELLLIKATYNCPCANTGFVPYMVLFVLVLY